MKNEEENSVNQEPANIAVSKNMSKVASTSNTSFFISDTIPPATLTKAKQDKEQNNKIWAFVSFIATIIPICLWIYCIIKSNGKFNENGPGEVWWLMIIYYCTLGFPLFIISLSFGVLGLKTKLCKLAIASILLKVTTIIGVALFLILNA